MNGKETSAMSIWDVFNEYADVRDELEDLMDSYEVLQEDIRVAMEDITDELNEVRQRLLHCDHIFKRYRSAKKSTGENISA